MTLEWRRDMSLREWVLSFVKCVDEAEAGRAAVDAGGPPYTGPFAMVLPTSAADLRWWADRLREAAARGGGS